jgi:4-hydroxy-3-methylbut-2-en-1-yl diphosphate reductase
MKLTLATHYGMCFGVRDALRTTQRLADSQPITILGELVHNPLVQRDLAARGAITGDLHRPGTAATESVVITAHGAADRDRAAWRAAGHAVADTTCPLVRKAHTALATLVAAGYHPIIIGQAQHVEVRGLAGDFPQAEILLEETQVSALTPHVKLGIVSQTTQPIAKVQHLVACIRAQFPLAEVVFRDTVCQPTKDRQNALEKLCLENQLVIVVGGKHSNNTRQLLLTAQALGARAEQVESAAELDPAWFHGISNVGITAGTSTLEETVQEVLATLRKIIA